MILFVIVNASDKSKCRAISSCIGNMICPS
jgi:hypothetical protein